MSDKEHATLEDLYTNTAQRQVGMDQQIVDGACDDASI